MKCFSAYLVLALLAPLGASAQNQMSYAGVINGDTVRLDDYAREIGRLTEYAAQRGATDPSDMMEQAWSDILRRKLVIQEASRRGLDLGVEEVDDILLNATPDFVKRGIVDAKGRFDRNLLRAMLYAPDSLVRANVGHLPAAERKQELDQLNASMNQLRERVGLIEVERRLKANVLSTFIVDTLQLRSRFRTDASFALADVILVPCQPEGPTPSVTEMETYHKAHAYDFVSPASMRRLAVLAWTLKATPRDSSVFLANIRSFVYMMNGAGTAPARDSIWTSVASTASTGSSRLSADSASHALFYSHVKGKRVGSAVGPIVHRTGIHVLLVDTVFAKKGKRLPDVSVRVMIAEFEPSRQTIDSVLRLVDKAAEDYERGMDLGEVATAYNRQIEVSPWFTDAEKIYGSYRLADVAFRTQRGAACDPIDTPERGVVLSVVVDSVPAGPMPFEAAAPAIATAIRRVNSCNARKDLAKTTRSLATRLDDGRLLFIEPPKGAQIARDLTIHANGMIGDVLYDSTATREIFSQPYPELIGPFLADKGWYVVNIVTLHKALDDEYPQWLNNNLETVTMDQQEKMWALFLADLRNRAEIDDNRWVFFRY